jgi:hypothetical protein
LASSLLIFLCGCGPKVVEHTITVVQVPERVPAPVMPSYTKIPEHIHIGSKEAATIIWKNFMEAEMARKSAYSAYKAYDSQITEDQKEKE